MDHHEESLSRYPLQQGERKRVYKSAVTEGRGLPASRHSMEGKKKPRGGRSGQEGSRLEIATSTVTQQRGRGPEASNMGKTTIF